MMPRSKIGILVTSIGNFGEKGLYNSQEIGLGKELSRFFNSVAIYKLVKNGMGNSSEIIDGFENVTVHYIQAANIGINGLINTKCLETDLDALLYFSDTQISLGKVYRWCKNNKIPLIPYIGVMDSHSESIIKRQIASVFSKRNLHIYRKYHCLAKTPEMGKSLELKGVKKVSISPVGLDVTLLHSSIDLVPIEDLKSKYGFSSKDKLILYVGRFVEEKRPLRAIEVFSKVHGKDEAYKLIMIGQGPMHSAIDECIRGHALEGYVTIVSHIPNKDMWEFYSMSDCFINLNQQEIFGMAILEAMYYGCKTVAWTAPGPDYIIDDGIDGYIVRSDDEVIDRILYKGDVSYASRNKILECFTWKATASNIVEVLK